MKKGSKMSEESRLKIKIARAKQIIYPETKIKISLALKGRKKPEGFSENLKRKRQERKDKFGYINSPETRLKIGKAGIGRKATEETRRKMSISSRGKNSRFWEGGITSLNLAIRRTYKYRLWRDAVFKRDHYTCVNCNKKGCYIEADHIEPFCLILKKNEIKTVRQSWKCKELWDIKNGQTLCKDCHKKTDTYKKKATLIKNKYEK